MSKIAEVCNDPTNMKISVRHNCESNYNFFKKKFNIVVDSECIFTGVVSSEEIKISHKTININAEICYDYFSVCEKNSFLISEYHIINEKEKLKKRYKHYLFRDTLASHLVISFIPIIVIYAILKICLTQYNIQFPFYYIFIMYLVSYPLHLLGNYLWSCIQKLFRKFKNPFLKDLGKNEFEEFCEYLDDNNVKKFIGDVENMQN